MTTSRALFFREITDFDSIQIPLGKIAFFREHFRNRLHQLVLQKFHTLEDTRRFTKADLARRIGKKPEQLTRWLGAPGNWTLDTVSDLLLGMGAELDGVVRDIEAQLVEADLPRMPVRPTPQPAFHSPLLSSKDIGPASVSR